MYGLMLTDAPVLNDGVVRDTEGCQLCWFPRDRPRTLMGAAAPLHENVAPPVTSSAESVEKSTPMP